MTEERDDQAEDTNETSAPKFKMPDDSDGWSLAERAGWYMLEKKGDYVLTLDLRGWSDVCDFFIIASGSSEVQVKALAKNLHDRLLADGHKPKGLEGLQDGRWALLDYFDVVVHIFHEDAREYFQLERLWGDAPKLELTPQWYTDSAVQDRHKDLNFTTAAGSGDTD